MIWDGLMSSEPVVSLRGITKRFPGVLANDGIDLEVRPGEIHALVGENGAGKTTLMKILYGIYQPDAGDIWIDGQRVSIRSPRDAIRLGIGMAFQQFALISSMTVAENIVLAYPSSRLRLRLNATAARLRDLSQRYGLPIDPHAPLWQLSVGEQQRVEILKALYRQARVLLLDEPTAVLTPQETAAFLQALRAMAGAGHALLFSTHKLQEVLSVAHRITVLRRGKVVTTVRRAETDASDLARAMIGRDLPLPLRPAPARPGEVALSVRALSARHDRGGLALNGVSFDLRQGEILGVAGMAGNGQRELSEVLVGLRPASAGKVYLGDRDVTAATPAELIRLGVGHIPEDRLGRGLIPQASVLDNLLVKAYRAPPIARGPFLCYRAARDQARRLASAFQVVMPRLDAPVVALSGGNQQRLLLARELATHPAVLVAVHPTRGLDVAASEQVHRLLLEHRQRGCAILLISEDLDELLALCDRIAVMYAGRITGVIGAGAADAETLGRLMAGGDAHAAVSSAEAGG
jgi:ABC-type uncharacterized transport system ATPase subunit